MKTSQAEWAAIRRKFLGHAAAHGVQLTLRDRVWAITDDGRWVALPGTSDSPDADKWWLGSDPDKLRARKAAGVILLCQSRGGPLYPIGLPDTLLETIEPKLARNDRQLFFNVAHRGGRFLLQLRGGDELDVTANLDDLSWLAGEPEGSHASRMHSFVAEGIPASSGHPIHARIADAPEPLTHRFFAIAKNKSLQPLDDVALEPGTVYLIEAREAATVPANASLRRILARGGPESLPVDFAERHDHYAHGAGRR